MPDGEVSFEAAFERYYPRLVALGVAMSGSVEVGHDAAQEAMLRACRRWGDVAEYEFVGAWLRRVLTNILIDRGRSLSAEARAVARTARWSDVDEIPEVSGWNELVDGLPDRQRMVVTLYYGDDRSIEEIAETLGVATGSVKSALGKARERLRETLGEGIES